MLYHEFKDRECIPEIQAIRPGAKDSVIVCDAGGLAKRMDEIRGNQTASLSAHLRNCIGGLTRGDLSQIAQSDDFIRRLEEEQFLSKAWRVRGDVVGSLPDIPAYIAGHPMTMRRRIRTKKPQGPLVLFLETTGSGSTFANQGPLMRGSAMLALARILAPQRPVELYVCTTFGRTLTMNAVLCRVETMPLDLGRACYMLTNLGDMSMGGHEVIRHMRADHDPGSWSYGTPDLERRYCGEIFRRFLWPDSEMLYVPAMFSSDLGGGNYYQWIKNMLVKYGGDSYVREEDAVEMADTGFVEG